MTVMLRMTTYAMPCVSLASFVMPLVDPIPTPVKRSAYIAPPLGRKRGRKPRDLCE